MNASRLAFYVMTAVTVVLAGCKENPAPPAPATPATTPVEQAPAAPRPTAAPTTATVAVSQVARSEYSSLQAEQCNKRSEDPESQEVVFDCPGIGGYRLRMSDADSRMTLDVLPPNGEPQPLDLWHQANGVFSRLGERVEWRIPAGGNQPTALIVRYEAYEDPAKPTIPASYLAVARVGAAQSCPVALIKPGRDQNDAARALADRISAQPCLPQKR